jgi:hypothetical protein
MPRFALPGPLGHSPLSLPLDSGTLARSANIAPGPQCPTPVENGAACASPTPASPPRITAAQLKARADEAYEKHPGSCSHSVWHVIQLYKADQAWINANGLVDQLAGSSDWEAVDVQQAGDLARAGALVVGGKKESGNGHVIVVYPGPDQAAGGYSYTRNGQAQTLRTRGSYPPAMSTSLGSWPGAMSRGDKTVWDPWANDAKFAQVKFWVYRPSR